MAHAVQTVPVNMGLPLWHYAEQKVDENDLSQSGERAIVRDSYLGVRNEAPAFETALDCFGVPVSLATWEGIYRWFFEAARSRGRVAKVLYFASAQVMNLAWSNVAFRTALRRADVVLNDGAGMQMYSRLAGSPFAASFDGGDLFPRLFACANPATPLRVFLYGGAPGRAEQAARNIEARFPGVRVVGTMDGASRSSAIEIINEACPDVLLVGMSNPMQEQWIDENRSLLDVGLVAGVGSLIESLGGERAPESRGRFARHVLGGPAFLLRAILYVGFGIAPRVW